MTHKKTFWGIREKLIGIFVLIKVVPLVVVAFIAWHAARDLGGGVVRQIDTLSKQSMQTMVQAGESAIDDAIKALDDRSREAIERSTVTTAQAIAEFLYQRDSDLLSAAQLPPTRENFQRFLSERTRVVIDHPPWRLAADGSHWEPAAPPAPPPMPARPGNPENATNFNQRPAETVGIRVEKPLYLEMSFVGLDGVETLKVGTSPLSKPDLRDVSDPAQTWWKAETYFEDMAKLAPGEIYVSEVIGPYIPSPLIGPYTPARAAEKGIAYAPEQAAYAGKENPVGKRFQGIVRWATPVIRGGDKIGYLTLVLDHTHLMEFTDHLVPTPERFSAISDAASGNYAFLWDYKGRNISHPRDYFIVGIDPETGKQAVPWLDEEMFANYTASGLSFEAWQKTAPEYKEQSLNKKPASDLTKAGLVALDCRYLNFAPQCDGWDDLTNQGGSGSFLIFWSGLWKLTNAAAVPYFTGRYGESPQGFGFVTIGANVHEFHRPATESGERIEGLVTSYNDSLVTTKNESLGVVRQSMSDLGKNLASSTLVMIVIVVIIAIAMAAILTRRITEMVAGIRHFQEGDLGFRFTSRSRDEMGALSDSFNSMADNVQSLLESYRMAQAEAESSSRAKSEFLATMSHELRTPLNAVLGYAQMLKYAPGASLTEKQSQYVDSIESGGTHLLSLIDDILDLAKVDVSDLNLILEDVAAEDVVEKAIDLVRQSAIRKNVQIIKDFPSPKSLMLHTDQQRLIQALVNLLSNAVKFNREKGLVTITIHEHLEGFLRIAVKDTGCGIAKDDQAQLFQLFHRVRTNPLHAQDGTGIGLSLSKLLIERMGGQIGFESEVWVGSTFWLDVPMAGTASLKN
ncbi:MAG: sensor histidine kinase [Magnetospiraceae bacterium]